MASSRSLLRTLATTEPGTYVTLTLPRMLHALHGIPGITRVWRSPGGDRYWVAVESSRYESMIIDRVGDALECAEAAAVDLPVAFSLSLVLPNGWNEVPEDAQACWPPPAGRMA